MSNVFHEMLYVDNNCYAVTNKRDYYSNREPVTKASIQQSLNFAWKMMTVSDAYQRPWRTGGSYIRDKYDVFLDDFRGKLAEYAFYHYCCGWRNVLCSVPNVDILPKGQWDNGDFDLYMTNQNNKCYHVSIKSTKHYGNLLLLEAENWTSDGIYIPSLSQPNSLQHPDIFILIRIADMCTKESIKPYIDSNNYIALLQYLVELGWTYDIAGYITHQEFCTQIIQNRIILPKGSYINRIHKSTRVDATNYYIQAGDMHPMARQSSIGNAYTTYQEMVK